MATSNTKFLIAWHRLAIGLEPLRGATVAASFAGSSQHFPWRPVLPGSAKVTLGHVDYHRDAAKSFASLMARADWRRIWICVTDLSEETMPIDATEFGAITINGKTYDHDVIIRLSGAVEKRRKRLSKEMYGTSHIVSKAEAKFVSSKTVASC